MQTQQQSTNEPNQKHVLCHRDRSTVASLYTKHHVDVKRFIAPHIGSAADAEDLTHDVFTRLCTAITHYDGGGTMKAYLFGIARNVIRDYIRRQRNNKKVGSPDCIEDTAIFAHVESNHHMLGTLSREELEAIICELESKLSPAVYEAVSRRFFEELSPHESACRIGCSVEAYKKRLQRGARILEQIMNKERAK